MRRYRIVRKHDLYRAEHKSVLGWAGVFGERTEWHDTIENARQDRERAKIWECRNRAGRVVVEEDQL